MFSNCLDTAETVLRTRALTYFDFIYVALSARTIKLFRDLIDCYDSATSLRSKKWNFDKVF